MDKDDENYNAGILTVEVPNTPKESAKTMVTANKVWIGAKPEGTAVTLYLYRQAGNGAPELVDTCTLDGTAENMVTPLPMQEDVAEDRVTVTKNGWSATWSNLDAYYRVGEKQEEYTWYISEEPIASFATTYSNKDGTVKTVQFHVNGDNVTAAPVTGTPTRKSITITNRNAYELPETGGRSSVMYILAGFILLGSAAYCLYKKHLAEGRIGRYS